ncbi:hypothetical protein BP5796_05127 [Coleophoma crateriformis]|uniref:Uncharacterized protein n=1 Tax=Coleophoma crateriformis TaxID=565419 RepID=A0A3D8S2C1_9HELO|nr:hypothetical protein BP5796_05127 [Coleophoma crateriformis]
MALIETVRTKQTFGSSHTRADMAPEPVPGLASAGRREGRVHAQVKDVISDQDVGDAIIYTRIWVCRAELE